MSPIKSKMGPALRIFCVVVTLMLCSRALLASEAGDGEMLTATGFAYHLAPGDTQAVARALALYGARYEAVLRLAEQLDGRGLLKNYGDRRMEIFCLTADEIRSTVVDESFSPRPGVFTIHIESRVALADFVRAEIKDAALEKEELEFSWQEEMDPQPSALLAPGQELSRAYRYIRNQQWRKAIIYIDHLEKKYPGWSELYLAKALGFEGLHEDEQAMRAYSQACERGSRQACRKALSESSED